ncbi:hypothetical protein A7K50_03265 [Dehalobacter sp. MCB1]|uniref:hypothetical protein n=1 Tax=Dehalobacter sp. MCB1 TaxID=1844756 RepID=UPI0003743643|nr:hypothetical protein [Dehalobacter sp. MCB1]RJE47681.1 hypothetical protein A7K50_03265 [Dehalobacter sp. MCB1]
MKIKKPNTSTLIVWFVFFVLAAFTIKILQIVENGGQEPAVLIGAVFAFCTGEFINLTVIKRTKIKHGVKKNDSNEGCDNNQML